MKKILFYSFCILAISSLGMSARSSNIECKLQVEPEIGECKLILEVSNLTEQEVCLNFSSGQQYDYIVKNSLGEEIWQWSEGKVFIYMQLLQQLYISPGEEHTFPEVWPYIDRTGNPVQPGVYMVQGILATTPDPIKTEWIEIDIPASYILGQLPPIKGKVTKILDKLYFLGENGIAYHIENPTEDLYQLQTKTIEVTTYQVHPIPGTVDKKIIIEDYAIQTNHPIHNSSNR